MWGGHNLRSIAIRKMITSSLVPPSVQLLSSRSQLKQPIGVEGRGTAAIGATRPIIRSSQVPDMSS